jgi:hypothetical protein
MAYSPSISSKSSHWGHYLINTCYMDLIKLIVNLVGDPELRVYFAKHVYVVWHHFSFKNFALQFISHFINHFFQSLIHTPNKHLAPVLGCPDYLVLARINQVLIAFECVLICHRNILQHRVKTPFVPYIPIAKAWGFGRVFGKHPHHALRRYSQSLDKIFNNSGNLLPS